MNVITPPPLPGMGLSEEDRRRVGVAIRTLLTVIFTYVALAGAIDYVEANTARWHGFHTTTEWEFSMRKSVEAGTAAVLFVLGLIGIVLCRLWAAILKKG